jgi:flagellar hook-basal body complex protein FliE
MSSINLQAVNAYNQVQSQTQTTATQIRDANNFQDMLRANMTQMHEVSQARSVNSVLDSVYVSQLSTASPSVIGVLKESLKKQEYVSLKSMVGQASTLDVVTATNESKNILDTITKIRNEMQQALDKILNMSI